MYTQWANCHSRWWMYFLFCWGISTLFAMMVKLIYPTHKQIYKVSFSKSSNQDMYLFIVPFMMANEASMDLNGISWIIVETAVGKDCLTVFTASFEKCLLSFIPLWKWDCFSCVHMFVSFSLCSACYICQACHLPIVSHSLQMVPKSADYTSCYFGINLILISVSKASVMAYLLHTACRQTQITFMPDLKFIQSYFRRYFDIILIIIKK